MTHRAPSRAFPAIDEDFLQALITEAISAGATDAEVRYSQGRALKVAVRNSALQDVTHAEQAGLRFTAYVGKRKAGLSSNELDMAALRALARQAVQMAQRAPEDAYCGLAPPDLTRSGADDHLQLFDPSEPGPEQLQAWALEVEDAGRAVEGVTACDQASAHWNTSSGWHLTSNGLSKRTRATAHSLGIQLMAGGQGEKETAGEGRTTRWRTDLPSPALIGATGGHKAVAKLGARKLSSCKAPVIFDAEVAMTLLAPLLGAISGSSIARGQSFLKDVLGQRVLPTAFALIEDPTIPRGLASRVSDGEGVETPTSALIERGVLQTWLLDCAAARQLKLKSNGHAGGPSNLTVTPGAVDRAGLMAQAGTGLLVTSAFSPSLNPHNGDWSAGVSGFWFEGGQVAYPVSEVTVAGQLPDIYLELEIGSDLEIRAAANAPSLLAPSMSISGK